MGFLDRLVSDMIRRETGFNARRVVRRIGGRNILMLGGALVAGGMMAARSQQSQGVGPASGGGAPPSIPPLGLPPLPATSTTSTTQTAATAALPPLPVVESGPEPPRDLVFAIVRTMVAAALADGVLSDPEQTAIRNRLSESELSEEQRAQVRRDLVAPPSIAELVALLPTGEDPELLAEFALLVARADDERRALEDAWLRQLATSLGLAEGRLDELERELFVRD